MVLCVGLHCEVVVITGGIHLLVSKLGKHTSAIKRLLIRYFLRGLQNRFTSKCAPTSLFSTK